MRRWTIRVVVGLCGLAAIFWFFARRDVPTDAPPPPTVASVGQATVATGEPATPVAESNQMFQTVLLPHAGRSARPDAVRIGVGRVSADDAEAHARWINSDRSGTGAADVSELASIDTWLTPPGTPQSDGSLRVGPIALPADADRFDLQARGEDPLTYYLASFKPHQPPAQIPPTLAAGLKIVRPVSTTTDVRVALRRVTTPDNAAQWQSLMAEQAPELLTAYDDPGITAPPRASWSPLPPGPVDVLLIANGVEAERQTVDLIAGRWTDVHFDEVAFEAAKAASATVILHLVTEGTGEPIEGVEITWYAERGDVVAQTDLRGEAVFPGVDRLRPHRFSLVFPTSEEGLPIWPESRPLELWFDEDIDLDDPRPTLRRTLEVKPLHWLLVKTGSMAVPMFRQGGNPYPIFVLQQQIEGEWVDVAADYFRPVSPGLAVSIQNEGDFRVMALASPWTVFWSQPARIDQQTQGTSTVALALHAGHSVDLVVTHNGEPMAHAPIAIRGPARGLPEITLATDAAGNLRLDNVTVPQVQIEAAGFGTTAVATDAANAQAELEVDEEAMGEGQ